MYFILICNNLNLKGEIAMKKLLIITTNYSGENFVAEEPWAEHAEISQNIITGQNQNSAMLIAEKILEYCS